jgi:hypothetical protein
VHRLHVEDPSNKAGKLANANTIKCGVISFFALAIAAPIGILVATHRHIVHEILTDIYDRVEDGTHDRPVCKQK